MFNFGFKAIIFYVISKCSYIFFCETEMFINFFNVNFFFNKNRNFARNQHTIYE